MDADAKKRAESIKKYFKDNQNIFLIALVAFTIITRLYYFFMLKSQPIWWDEGDYLAIAKVWALNLPIPEWWSHFTGMRPLLLPIIWAAMFKIGFSELLLRFFTLLLPSIGSVYLTYLLGNSLFNKKIGIAAGFMLSVYWVFSFYSFRLLTDIPATFFGLISLYYFWEYYVKKEKALGLYLCFLFGVIAFSIRFPFALVPISCVVYAIFVKKHKFFMEKTTWIGGALGLLFVSPYLIYFILNKFAALRFYFGANAVSIYQPIGWHLIPFLFTLIESLWSVTFAIGLVCLYPLVIYFDIIWKQKTKDYNAHLFVIIGLVVHLIFYVFILRDATDRWLLMLMPYIFFICAIGLQSTYNLIKKYNSAIAAAIVLILLFGGAYQNLTHANALIINKKDTYGEVKAAGLWLKENTPADTKVITSSIVQNQYYSERASYDFHTNDTIWASCSDKLGALSANETCQNLTEQTFNKKIADIKPDYLIVSVFEPVFTPQWAYSYGERNNLTVVKVYTDANNNPSLIIYKV